MENSNTTYNLYSTERKYQKDTLITYYFQPNKKIIKKSSPIDINGERMRLHYDTGELSYYKKNEILSSYNVSLRRTTILMNMLLNMNSFSWFWTLTFDKERIDRTNDKQVFNCYKKYINNIKKQLPNFRYMCFPERHEDNCIHFHLLTGGISVNDMGLVNSGKVCCSWAKRKNGIASKSFYENTKNKFINKETDGEPIFNITTFAYGYTTVSRIVSRDRCNSYVKKYVEKALGSTDIFKKRFYYSHNLKVPTIVKKLVGADFEEIYDIDKISNINNSEFVKNAQGKPYISEYNTMQIKIDNDIKNIIEQGFIPLSQKEQEEINNIF